MLRLAGLHPAGQLRDRRFRTTSGMDLEAVAASADAFGCQDSRSAPQKGSSTISPRREQSRVASATSATRLTVGCEARSSIRPARKVLAPATPKYSIGCDRAGQA